MSPTMTMSQCLLCTLQHCKWNAHIDDAQATTDDADSFLVAMPSMLYITVQLSDEVD